MKKRLRDLFLEFGLDIDPIAIERFDMYLRLLSERGKEMNLIADTDPEEIMIRHYLDSLSLVRLGLQSECDAIDVGTGAGFPGIPIKICMPAMSMTLLDSLGKRLEFLVEVKRELGLEKLTIVNARAEEAALLPTYREKYHYVFSRAVARMNMLTEICLPFAEKGGTFYAMKSQHSEDEVREAAAAVKFMGGRILENYDYELPGRDMKLRILRVEKISLSPKGYPRRFAKIKQKPI